MKQFSLICLFSSLLLTSCTHEDDHIALPIAIDFWKESHTSRLFLNNAVHEVKEYTLIENERFVHSQMKFNNQGYVTGYYPVNQIEPESPTGYWLPTGSQSFEYTYSGYNLTGVRILEWGQSPVDITFVYGNTTRYLPVSFLNMKPLSQLFLQGVSAIKSSDSSVSFEYTEDKAVIGYHTGYQTTIYTYFYENSDLPYAANETLFLNEDESEVKEERNIKFSYFDNGAIHKMDIITLSGNIRQSQHYEYDSKGNLVLHKRDTASQKGQCSYQYNTGNLLTGIEHTDGADIRIGHMNAMYDLDESRNWTRCEKRVTGFIDWDLREGNYVIYRDIIY